MILLDRGDYMEHYYYCPHCGEVQGQFNQQCVKCFSNDGVVVSQHDCDYYDNLSFSQYGDYYHAFDFLEPEIRANPLFDEKEFSREMTDEDYARSLEYFNSQKVDSEFQQGVPKCPICGSTNIQKISGAKKSTSAILFGVFSNDIGKTFECKNCRMKF